MHEIQQKFVSLSDDIIFQFYRNIVRHTKKKIVLPAMGSTIMQIVQLSFLIIAG